MKKLVFLTLFFTSIFLVGESTAQSFNSAIGARLGVPLSVSYKQFLNESAAFEIVAGARRFNNGIAKSSWTMVSAAYQVHKPIGEVEGFDWYFGGGGAIFFWNFDDGFIDPGSNTSFGLQGYLGLSYTFANTPINLSVDWVPTYFLNGFGSGFSSDSGSFGIRYTF